MTEAERKGRRPQYEQAARRNKPERLGADGGVRPHRRRACDRRRGQGGGGRLRTIAPFSALAGGAMQFIWVDSATMVHPVIGVAFFIWLLVVGAMLAAGATERLFLRMVAAA